ncbi:amino acid adenylation domain-containing protein [Candidatus Enterococcus mansonii]|uniref:Carrier domain-containing protein n=1 Tax=Candidatus Enterococcus mansonii TaxID=1834181 RepID=A0A242CIX8_9ENTE|nr:amino acid adenylation domain-containing protein [Enterococcus sp. 4G2_DIV0659]OTO10078.1 hypothetical protein A5880_000761 [Enterococcus sp. 4G2_DIV0659]
MIFENAYPLSKLQEGMIYHSERENSDVYHDIFTYWFEGYYDYAKIKECFQLIAEQNPVLRTSFELDKFSEPIQVVNKEILIEVSEFYSLEEFSSLEKELNDYILKRKAAKFDWNKAPLWKVAVFKKNSSDFVICLDFHHSILDGWSIASMMQAFSDYYLSLIEGKKINNKFFSKAGYDEYIKLEKEAIEDKESCEFWKSEIKHSNAVSLTAVRNYHSGGNITSKGTTINTVLIEKMNEISKKNKVPLKYLCLSAHFKVLSLLTNEAQVTTGIVSNGRVELEGDNILGLFLNTLPFTMNLEDLSWDEFIYATFEKEKKIMPYRRYPMVEMMKNFSRGNELFNVVFNYIDFHVYQEETLQNNSFKLNRVDVSEKTNFPFSVQFSNNPISKELTLSLIYDQDIFEEKFISRVLELFINTIRSMSDGERIFNNISILNSTENEIDSLLDTNHENSSKEQVSLPLFIDKFLDCSIRLNEQIAVYDKNKSISYRELNDNSDRMASYLVSRGVNPGDSVGVYLDRSIDLVTNILAIWKIGACYVPLDRKFPNKRIEYIIQDLNIKTIVSGKQCENNVFDQQLNILFTEDGVIYPKSEDRILSLNRNSLAYVIYTSGTTGNPKGVCVAHESIANLVNHYRYTTDDKVLMTFNIAFDGCLFDILISLASGAALCVPTAENLVGEILIDNINSYEISILTLTPTVLSSIEYQEFDSLRMISVAGEKCSLTLAKMWGERYVFRNLYGPSEGTICATEYTYDPLNDSSLIDLPIGKSISNVEINIVDSNLQPLPEGVVGEICISGRNLALGYTSEIETSKSFRSNIFQLANQSDKKFYLSGDRGKVDHNRNLFFVGRDDSQVKVNGIRMEISEIENKLETFCSVEYAIVRVKRIENNDKIVAYLVLNDKNGSNVVERLENYLKQYLPLYMIPSEFKELDKIPQNSNGKIDSSQLDNASKKLEKKVEVETLPRNDSEIFVHDLICSALSKEQVSIYDNIFELGCNSLMILEIQKKINAKYNIEMSIQNIFDNPTVEKISLEILKLLLLQSI